MQQPTFRGKKKETGEWVYGFGWVKTNYTKEHLEELPRGLNGTTILSEGRNGNVEISQS